MIIVAALVAGQASSQAPEAPAPIEIARAGDGNMSCEQIRTEMADLSQRIATEGMRQQNEVQDMANQMTASSMGMGGLTGLASAQLASMIPFGSQILAQGRQLQVAAAQRRMIDKVATMQASAAALGPIQGRLDHLGLLHATRRC